LKKNIPLVAASFLNLMLLCAVAPAQAAVGTGYWQSPFAGQKQETKAAHRWSINDWFEAKGQMQIQDMFLALNTPSPYEFLLSGGYSFGSLSPGPTYNGAEFALMAYASIFGLELEREMGPDNRWAGLFHLRFFGYHYQATHLRLELGIRQEENGSTSFRNALAGVGGALYFGRFFGIDGLFRYTFNSTSTPFGSFSGYHIEGGAFIDFKFLRFFGKYFYENNSPELMSGPANGSRQGPLVGLKLFF
jgi:hypothetical protein